MLFFLIDKVQCQHAVAQQQPTEDNNEQLTELRTLLDEGLLLLNEQSTFNYVMFRGQKSARHSPECDQVLLIKKRSLISVTKKQDCLQTKKNRQMAHIDKLQSPFVATKRSATEKLVK